MTIYYITLILVVPLSFLAEKFQTNPLFKKKSEVKTRSIFVWAVAAVFIFFAGFRYGVGSDWYAYYANDHQAFVDALSASYAEPGWNIIGYLSTLVVDKYGVAMFVAAFITISLYIKTIAEHSENFALSIVFYFLLSWYGCFNGVRQYLAAAILFAGHKYIYQKKLWKWILVVAFASVFHVTAIVMVFWYFVANNKFNKKQVLILVLISVVLYFSYDRIFELVGTLKGEVMEGTDGYSQKQVSIFRILVNWAPILFYYVFILNAQKDKYDSKLNFYMNMAFLDALLMSISMNSAYLARVGIYTGPFVILMWPLMLKRLDPKSRNVMTLILLICYGAFWYYDISIHADLNNFRLLFGNV